MHTPPLAAVALRMRKEGGFTLIELLVVIALIAGLSVALVTNLREGDRSVALKSAQAAVAGTFTVARAKAMSSGRPCRVLLNIDVSSPAKPARFLRYMVLQSQTSTGWQTITDMYLPDGTYVVPGDFAALPPGLFLEGAAFWVKAASAAPLRSTMLRSGQISSEAVNSTRAEDWVSLSISASGTSAQAGDLVLAVGRPRVPGSYAAGESPVELYQRDRVCGITFSSYGLAVLIGDRSGF